MAKKISPPRSNDLAETHGELVPPESPGSELMRDVLAVSAKALLSSIPFATLVFDIGEKVAKFANDMNTRRYFAGLIEKIDVLRTQVADIERRLQIEDATLPASLLLCFGGAGLSSLRGVLCFLAPFSRGT